MNSDLESERTKRDNEVIELNDKELSERSRLLIEQMRQKLELCEKKAVERINEIDIVLEQDGMKDRAYDEIKLWQEKYKLRQELKDDSFRSKIIDRLKKWNV